MGGCCSDAKNEGVKDDEEQGELEQLLRDQQGLTDDAPMIQLHIKCRGLRHPPGNSRVGKVPNLHSINAYVAAYMLDGEKKTFIAHTEQKFSNANPEFVKALTTTYEHEAQEILFECRDRSRGSDTLLGSTKLKILDIMGHDKGTEALLEKPITQVSRTGEKKEVIHQAGHIAINAEETKLGPKYEVVVDLSCHSLDSKNYLGAGGSDPYLVISRIINGQFTSVYTTEHFDGVLACEWKTIVISLEKLCKGDFNQWLLFEVWDWENSGPHRLIGYTRQTLANLLADLDQGIDLINDNQRGTTRTHGIYDKIMRNKTEYVRSGVLQVRNISIDISYSFLEYKKSGFDINVTICVDFSSSNEAQNLHAFDKEAAQRGDKQKNHYSEALEKVVDILGTYDKDQEFPFYGFGALVDRGGGQGASKPADDDTGLRLPFLNRAADKADPPANIFHVTMDSNNYCVHGAQGILDAYWDVWKNNKITPAEPSCFASCLSKVYRVGSGSKSAYQIALIVTDGGCSDIQDTVDMIVDMSSEPISIIIIGVGSGPWDTMEMLSADDQPLTSSTKKMMKRDIVGFVEMDKYPNKEALQREVLKEIPRQFTSWAKQHKIKPGDNLREEKERKDKEKGIRTPSLRSSIAPASKTMIEASTCMDTGAQCDFDDPPQRHESPPPPPPLDNDGWESFSDDDTGQMYYHNKVSGDTQWTMPTGYRSRSGRASRPVASPRQEVKHIADVPYVRLGAAQSQKRVHVHPVQAHDHPSSPVSPQRQTSSIGNLIGLSGSPLSGPSQPGGTPVGQTSRPFPQASGRGGGLQGDYSSAPAARKAPGSHARQPRTSQSYEPPAFSPLHTAVLSNEARNWASQKSRSSGPLGNGVKRATLPHH